MRKINIVVVGCTGLAYVSIFFSPSFLSWLGFLGYSIPFLLVLNLIFLLYWIVRANMNLLWSLITIILGMGHVSSSYSFSMDENAIHEGFSVMSYNVNCFNPKKRKGQKDKLVFKKITDRIISSNPSILCLQEYCSYPTIDNFNTQKKLFSRGYTHFTYKNRWTNTSFSTAGLAIFSKFPMIARGEVIKEEEETIAIYADLIYNEDTIRIFNTHLFSMGLINPNNNDSENNTAMIQKLRHGFAQKALEADLLYDEIENSPFPVIVVGDFNEIPFSYVYRRFKKKFNNSFEVAGNGFGTTYNGKIPLLRIDNQFSDQHFKITSHKIISAMNTTDHLPILVHYQLD